MGRVRGRQVACQVNEFTLKYIFMMGIACLMGRAHSSHMDGNKHEGSDMTTAEAREAAAATALLKVNSNADCYSKATMLAEVARLQALLTAAKAAIDAI